MRVSLIEPLNVDEDLIKEYGAKIEALGHDFTYYPDKTTDPGELLARSEGQDIVMIANNPYPREVIEGAKDLKLLNVAFTGFDHVDTETLKERNISLCNASGYSDQGVAELVLGLVIGLYRKMKEADRTIRESGLPIMGREIAGKKVGIIGTGNIGIKTAKIFKAFGADLLGYDLEEKEGFLSLGGSYVTKEDLLKEADIVSLHLPSNNQTRGFIGWDDLGLMKESAIFINCARGPIVDNEALARALNEALISGAGIDVFDMEPPIPGDYPLLGAKNTILTPHVAYLTEESMLRRAHIAFDNTLSFLQGRGKNLIDL